MSQGKKPGEQEPLDPAAIPTRITKPAIPNPQGRTLEEPLPEDFANPKDRDKSQVALLPLSTNAAKLMPLVEEKKKPIIKTIDIPNEKTIERAPKEHLPLIERARFNFGEERQENHGKLTLAFDKHFSREVFHWEALRGVNIDAFFREPRLVAGLQHPGILPVYDIGRSGSSDPVYITAAFQGQSFDSLLVTVRNPSERLALLPCIVSLARIIAYAHEKNICHLNLSPRAILVSSSRQVVVVNWRYAQTTNTRIPAAEVPPITEDPEYRPPEQLSTDNATMTTDVYAIGAILYRLLCGSTPATRNGATVPLEEFASWLPSPLTKIVNRAVAVLPEQRYPSAKELLFELEKFEAEQLSKALVPTRAARVVTALKERVLLILFAIAVTAGLLLTRSDLSNEKERAAKEEEKAKLSVASAIQAQKTAEERTATLLLRFAHDAIERDPTEAIVWLKSLPEAQSAAAAARLIASDAREHGVAQRILNTHQTPITRLAVSPAKKLVASASEDRTVRIWNTDTGESTVLQGHTDTISALAFSPDEKFVASTGKDKTARVFSLSGEAGQALPLDGFGTDISFSPDGTRLAVSDSEGRIYLWEVSCITPGQPSPCAPMQKMKRHDGDAYVIRFSRDGQWIASGGKDKKLQLSMLDGSEPLTFSGHSGAIWDLEYSPDQTKIITAGQDGSLRVWELSDPKKKPEVLSGHSDPIADIALSPDGRFIASASFDDSVKLWQWEEPKKKPRVFKGHKDRVYKVAFSPDGAELASASKDGTARRWDLSCVNTDSEDACGPLQALRGHRDALSDLVFYGEGRLASASKDSTIRLWTLTKSMSLTWKGHDDIAALALSSDQKTLASVGADKTVRVWDVTSGQEKTLGSHKKGVTALALSSDGKRLATASKEELKVWSVDGGDPTTFAGHSDDITALTFSPDGKRLASASKDKTIRLWDVASAAAQKWSGHKDEVLDVAFSSDGKWLASGGKDGLVFLWDEAGAQKLILSHKDAVFRVVFSPDGRFVASASKDKSIQLWDIQAQSARTLEGHLGAVLDLAFSPDNKLLASSGADKTVRVWEMGTDKNRIFTGHQDDVIRVVFSQSGEYLLSASRDKTARRWEVNTGLYQVFSRHKKELVSVASAEGSALFFSAGRDGDIKALRDDLPKEIKELQSFLRSLVTVEGVSSL
jgi:WD40 repeat protein/serine/threonine protein kinase